MQVCTTHESLTGPQFRQLLKNYAHYFVVALIGLSTSSSLMVAQDSVLPATPASAAAIVQAGAINDESGWTPSGSSALAYWYGPNYRTPFVTNSGTNQAADIPRNSLEYSRLDLWTFGSNLTDVMVNQSGIVEPASGGGVGATEVYVTMRTNVGLDEVTRSKAFARGPLRDISIEVGANLETKNSSFAPAERTIYFGPKIQLAVPKGYFDVGLHLRKEWDHEGVLGKSEDYDPDFNIEAGWMVPFGIGEARLGYSGFAEYNTKKGTDSFGVETVPEFLVRNYVSLDVGALLYHKPQIVDLDCGFWYWHNEYGKPASDPGAGQMTPMFGITFHLNGVRARQGQAAASTGGRKTGQPVLEVLRAKGADKVDASREQ